MTSCHLDAPPRADLTVEAVPGDNNCIFHALKLQLGRQQLYEGNASQLRSYLVEWMRDHQNERIDTPSSKGDATYLKNFCPGHDFQAYLESMAEDGVTWGDHCCLVAAAMAFRVRIRVFSTLPEQTEPIVISPHSSLLIAGTICLGHYSERHYVSTQAFEGLTSTVRELSANIWSCSASLTFCNVTSHR